MIHVLVFAGLCLLPAASVAQAPGHEPSAELDERKERLIRQLRAIEANMQDVIDRTPATITGRPGPRDPAAAKADDEALEVEGDEAEHYVTTLRDQVVRDLVRRNPGAGKPEIALMEAVPPAADDPGGFGIIFIHYELPGGGNASLLDVAAYRAVGKGARYAGTVDVWGAGPRDVERGRGHVTFTTTIPRESDPRCCPSGWMRFRVNTTTLAVSVVAAAE